ncbi:hypothetical protein BC941DRAFT_509812 [Chlamydoabsidia padenii]|nr:hypothetical protein BC941DRAFT_509812 [Chlamydoabsidia padenii]
MMNVTKFNSTVARQATNATRQQTTNIVARASTISSLHTSSIQQKSIVEKAKDLGHEVNMKVGKGLAQGIEGAESVAQKAPSPKGLGEKVKQVGQEVNLKAGQGLAQGIESVENVAKKVPDAQEVREKAKNVGQEAKESIDKVSNNARNLNAEDVKEAGKESISKSADKVGDAINDASDKLGNVGKDRK